MEKDGGPQIVCLSQVSLDILGAHGDVHCVPNGEQKLSSGRQLRRHPIKWRKISTLEATRLLLRNMPARSGERKSLADGKKCHDVLYEYQQISDSAAVKQLGPPRMKNVIHA